VVGGSAGRTGAGRRWPLVLLPAGVVGGAGLGLPAAEAFARQCLVALSAGWGLATLARSLRSGRRGALRSRSGQRSGTSCGSPLVRDVAEVVLDLRPGAPDRRRYLGVPHAADG